MNLESIIGAGNSFILCAGEGDRIYNKQAPTITSVGICNGKVGGACKYKIQLPDGSRRPIKAEEIELIMGWEPTVLLMASTSLVIAPKERTTQRVKILGNGVIPAEITDILSNI